MTNIYRINKYIALSTGCSRRRAEDYIKSGYIKVNNKTIYNLSTKVTYGLDEVKLHDSEILPRNYIYYAINKPAGYCSTRSDPFAKLKVVDLVPKHPPVFPVGRLDKNSEGLMILTNDGDFSYKITHPSSHIEKEYFVEAYARDNSWSIKDLMKLKKGINLGAYRTRPTEILGWKHIGSKVTFYIILKEGKKRQIRKMVDKIGLNISVLNRVRIGNLKLGNLQSGEYKKIIPHDVLTNT